MTFGVTNRGGLAGALVKNLGVLQNAILKFVLRKLELRRKKGKLNCYIRSLLSHKMVIKWKKIMQR